MVTMENLIARGAPCEEMLAHLVARCIRPEIDCYYFGWHKGAGHGFSAKGQRCMSDCYALERKIEAQLGSCIDTRFCWNGPKSTRDQHDARDETEGHAFVTHTNNLTVLAFWDRSGDKRGASNTAFICPGTLTFAQIVRVARFTWPGVWSRFHFAVVEVDARGREVTPC